MRLRVTTSALTCTLFMMTACGPPASSGSGNGGSGNGAAQDAGPAAAPDAGSVSCDWPTENLGVAAGQHVPSNLAWQGLGPGEDQERNISIEEFFDCDGSRGVHAVLLVTSQYGCSRCNSQASGLTQMLASWAEEGLNIQVLTLKIEDSNGSKPASMEGVNHWRDAYGLSTSFVAFDNGYTMIPREGGGGVSFGTPLNSVIDPRTMEVVEVIQTFDRSYASLLEVARRNAAQ